MILFILFLAIPLIEIALFITVGGAIGLWPTLAIVIVTPILGTYLVRQQGVAVLREVQSSFSTLNDPTEPLAHGAMILLSGALLLTPGFFTDAFGFALLIPAFRSVVFRAAKARIKVSSVQFQSTMSTGGTQQSREYTYSSRSDADVIEADYTDLDKPDGPSGWTQPRD